MLGKLMKYEFLATGRQILPAYMGVVLFAVLNRILLEIGGGFEQFWDGTVTTTPLANIVFGFLIFFYVMAIFAVGILTTILIIRRFYINLFKDEGYLANTLPVSVDTHIWGKLIPAACWNIASAIVILVSVWIILGGVLGRFAIEFAEARQYIWSALQAEPLTVILSLLIFIVSFLVVILAFYSALSIGQLAKRRKILLAIGAYFGMSFLFSIVSTIFQVTFVHNVAHDPFFYSTVGATTDNGPVFLLISLGLVLLQGAIHYFITRYILKNKLNLE